MKVRFSELGNDLVNVGPSKDLDSKTSFNSHLERCIVIKKIIKRNDIV